MISSLMESLFFWVPLLNARGRTQSTQSTGRRVQRNERDKERKEGTTKDSKILIYEDCFGSG